jgi:hypothetical protein
MYISRDKSPMGYFYKFTPQGTPFGERLARKVRLTENWSCGKPEFSIQAMQPEELIYIAELMKGKNAIKS